VSTEGYRNGLQRFADLDAEYEILRELGRGGTAVVYLARDRELDREVAIKVIRATYVEDEGAAARMIREARTASLLQHPNIVMLYGTRRLGDGSLALVMQYARGRTLKTEVRTRGPLPFEDVERIVRDVAAALDCAHRQRIVHRDVKPENIYLDDETGGARLSDFGIARPWDADCSLTLPGMAIGTPAYMSPEQIDGNAVDGRSDIYSLGLVAYEMLTGRAPWAGENLYSIIYRQKHEELPSLEQVRPGVPARLRRVIERALQKDPAARWDTAGALMDALKDGEPAGTAKRGGNRKRTGRGRAGRRGRSRVATGPSAAAASAVSSQPDVPPEENVTVLYRRDAAVPTAPRQEPPEQAAAAAKEAHPAAPKQTAPTANETAALAQKQTTAPAHEVAAPAPKAAAPARKAAARAPKKAAPAAAAAAAAPAPAPAAAAAAPERIAGTAEPLERRRPSPTLVAAVLAAVLVGTPVYVAVGSRPAQLERTAQPAAEQAAIPDDMATLAGPDPGAPANGAAAVVGGAAAVAYLLYGDTQEGTAGDTLAAPLVVRVEDSQGRPVSGAPVTFVVREGESSVLPAQAVTDEYGLASVRWLPEVPGQHRVEAVLEGVDEAPVFRASVAPPAGVRLVVANAAAGARGAAGTRLEVRAEDAAGRPVAGAEVLFAATGGGGRVQPARAATGRDGVARAQWTQGRSGAQEAEARIAGTVAEPVVFRAEREAERVAVRAGVVTGGTHTCVLTGEGVASCWGGNESGQLGDGSGGRRGGAVAVAGSEPFARVSAGISHTCGVSVSGTIQCWGANTAGQLGDGTRVGRARPVPVRSDAAFTDVFAGMSHTCGLDREGRLHCWGDNAHGQLGDGTRTARESAVRVSGGRRIRTASAGWAHTCAIATDGTAWCWGRNSSGELGDGSTTDRAQPRAVAGRHRFSAIAVGSAHTCGLRTDGAILCWGQNSHGQVGNGEVGGSTQPVVVSAPEAFSGLTVGGVHSCGLGRSGTAYCWGRNTYGQLGDGTMENRWQPVEVEGGLRFTSLQASGAHTCGTAGGAQYCWGYNIEGQLGTGSRTNQSRPSRVTARR
jgi:alpha-tubulin suppressor-like RCC1 family protein/tRNA A-37 threonylcarbamoyl transferase component Bud32